MQAIGTLVLRIRGKLASDVGQPRSAEQRIDDGMHQHVGVGVPRKTLIVGNVYTAKNQGTAWSKAVNVVANTDAKRGGPRALIRRPLPHLVRQAAYRFALPPLRASIAPQRAHTSVRTPLSECQVRWRGDFHITIVPRHDVDRRAGSFHHGRVIGERGEVRMLLLVRAFQQSARKDLGSLYGAQGAAR